MAQKKYVSLNRLANFLENLNNKFASLVHTHKLSDITDYKVDTQLSSTSSNPVQNKVIDAEFEAVSEAMSALELAIDGKSDTSHNHDSVYDAKGTANSALASAKTYADSAATTAANKVKNDLLNGAGAAYDTLKELGDLITENQDAIDALETVAAGKADKVHTHAIADVSGLQSALDGKAASSHGTHVSYSTTAPVMDGTASVGSASTVARSDHKHPTDTSRASKTEFDTHASNTTVHITSTERSNWNAAKTHADSAHAPSNAEKNQNAFSNIAVGSTTVAADSATDTVTFVGSNVTITPDATNDKITFAVADGSTSAAGIVKLTNSTSSTSTTTAATPSSVKSAYDLANTAKTNAATAQTKADSAYSLAESKADSLSDLGVTATAAELNHVDGVTSNIQTQLDGKAASSHNHSAANITSGTIAAARLPSASGSAAGITIVYPAASCTTFSSDSGTVTPLAVQKGAKMFAITRPSATTNNAIVRYSNTTGDVQNSKIIIEDVTNTRDTSKQANVIAIPAEGNKKMVYGYCTDQIDGTSFIGGVFDADATEYPYSAGLAIGGTSGNLLWKGTKVATTADLSGYSTTGHTHNYAGSSSAGGSATSAVKLDTSTAGSATQPVYFSDGKPVATTYTLGASVPSGAKFTDTTYGVVSTTANGLAPKRDGSTTKFLRGDGTWAVPPDTNTTYSAATQSASGLMSAADKKKLDGIATGANNYTYTLPTASSSTLGGVKTTSTVASTSGLTACPIIGGVPYYKDTNTTYTLSSLGAAAANHNHANQNINPQCIELGSGSTSHGGYIDFHFKGNTGDYTSRIIEQKSGLLSILGGLVLNSSAYGSSLPSAGTAGRIFFKKV